MSDVPNTPQGDPQPYNPPVEEPQPPPEDNPVPFEGDPSPSEYEPT